MGTHIAPNPKSDEAKPPNTANMPPPTSSTTCPPETPPLIDPTNFRFSRLTPNIKDMMHSWTPALNEPNPSTTDIFASPDPTAMYNSMALPSPSPLLRDFYQTGSPVIGVTPFLNHETAEIREMAFRQRAEKLSSVCEEMNGLFANLPNPAETENRSDNNVDAVASNISSPEHDQLVKDSHIKTEPTPQQTQATSNIKNRQHTSQSSSETRPILDTSSISPSSSPQLTETHMSRKPVPKPRKLDNQTKKREATKKSGSKSDKAKRSSSRTQALTKSQPKLANQISVNATASAMAAANAFAMNPALAGMIPFPGHMAAGIPQMYPGSGTVIYQGRPMAFIAGARGPELIPIDMLAQAQASAAQFGAAQALQASGQMNGKMGSSGSSSPNGSPYESSGSSRKKRRRQMLERSGCSEEQARENRARALKRLRQKKTVRSQSSTVRYACRKRIAMVRPRVNGRFATKEEVEQCQQEGLLKQ